MTVVLNPNVLAVKIPMAAAMLDVSRAHIYQLVKRGELRRVTLPGSTASRILVEDLYQIVGLEAPAGIGCGQS